jgi:hypothetical protein
MGKQFQDLVLDTGELVRIEFDGEHEDAFYDSLEYAMKRGDWWCPSQFDGCSATYLGSFISRISMRRVVGML